MLKGHILTRINPYENNADLRLRLRRHRLLSQNLRYIEYLCIFYDKEPVLLSEIVSRLGGKILFYQDLLWPRTRSDSSPLNGRLRSQILLVSRHPKLT